MVLREKCSFLVVFFRGGLIKSQYICASPFSPLRWQLQAARDPGARPIACLPAFRRQTDRLPAVQQPEEPGQVQRPRARLLPEELRRR